MEQLSSIDKAVQFMVDTANNNKHGYDQASRWGPDYDCSSLVITAYEQAGIKVKSAGATYTGNMKKVFLKCGFKDVTGSVSVATGSGLQKGDVLLNERNHTAMYIGNGKVAQASINEKGTVTGGVSGDQTGGEINVRGYYNFPWDCVLRLSSGNSDSSAPIVNSGSYTVRSGDTLSSIAEALYGDWTKYTYLKELNGLTSDTIYPGQVLKTLEGISSSDVTCQVTLPELKAGATGKAVEAMQYLLICRGYALPLYGPDSDFGEETGTALRAFQRGYGLDTDGVCGKQTWTKLINGG